MAMTRYDFFYDQQIRRFEMQLVRAFSGFQYESGGRNGKVLKMVPCSMAKRDRQVAAILRNLSENTLLSVPMITVAKTGMEFAPDRLQNPHHVESLQVLERGKDPITGEYNGERGNSLTIDRMMPRPFNLRYQIDIWTSNEDQKHQLLEQILTIIYPSFDIQNSDNGLDWSALTSVMMEDITWSSRAIAIGTESEIDVATINVKLPIWLTPPAKVKRQNIIKQIITNINNAVEDAEGEATHGARMAQHVTTVGDHLIEVNNGQIKLLGPNGSAVDSNGDPYKWSDLFNKIGVDFYPMMTQLRLRTTSDLEDDSKDIIGSIQEGASPNLVHWQIDIDTLPANTLTAVHAIIDPLRSFPGEDGIEAVQGRRYLLTSDLGTPSLAWGNITAGKGSILEFKDGLWIVSFDASATEDHYLVNLLTGRQLRWFNGEWVMAINGTYHPGYWFIA